MGCFHCGEFRAIASFHEKFVGFIEVTVWASRGARWSWLAPGIWNMGTVLLEDGGVKELYCVLARFHKENRKLAEACWMEYDGTRRMKVTAAGRIIEWMRYSINRLQWIRRNNVQQVQN